MNYSMKKPRKKVKKSIYCYWRAVAIGENLLSGLNSNFIIKMIMFGF